MLNKIKAWFKKRKQNPNRARILSKSEPRKSKQPTKPYFVTMDVTIKGHRIGSFPITVQAYDKNHARAIINKETTVKCGVVQNASKQLKNVKK
jgi:hypothetical protein